MKLFTTGEFAEICGVKKQTLFHYDDIGLLKPDYKKDNGYRYYSIQQFEVFTVIEMLKEIDMSLMEIKHFIETKNPRDTIKLLKEQEKMMEQKIIKMQQLKRQINNKRVLIENSLKLDFDLISIQEIEGYHYILSDPLIEYTDKSVTKALMNFIKNAKILGVDSGYPIGILFPKTSYMNDNYQKYTHFYLRVDKEIHNQTHYRSSGCYIVAYHKGSYVKIHETYERIKQYLKQYHYEVVSDGFEEYLLDEVSVSGLDNYVTEITIEVKIK